MLNVDNIFVSYDKAFVIDGVSLQIGTDECICILGSNGSGKTTLLRTISGILHPSEGNISFMSDDITNLPSLDIVNKGIVHVQEERGLFYGMSVLENLELGAYRSEARVDKDAKLTEIFNLFPILEERQKQLARSLSGGEQQMLAIARGLMAKPKLLMLDEPSLGLAPVIQDRLFDTIKLINNSGIGILLVEQNAFRALPISSRAYVLENGKVVLEGSAEDLWKNNKIKEAYISTM